MCDEVKDEGRSSTATYAAPNALLSGDQDIGHQPIRMSLAETICTSEWVRKNPR
jgi:hypothetical protein